MGNNDVIWEFSDQEVRKFCGIACLLCFYYESIYARSLCFVLAIALKARHIKDMSESGIENEGPFLGAKYPKSH